MHRNIHSNQSDNRIFWAGSRVAGSRARAQHKLTLSCRGGETCSLFTLYSLPKTGASLGNLCYSLYYGASLTGILVREINNALFVEKMPSATAVLRKQMQHVTFLGGQGGVLFQPNLLVWALLHSVSARLVVIACARKKRLPFLYSSYTEAYFWQLQCTWAIVTTEHKWYVFVSMMRCIFSGTFLHNIMWLRTAFASLSVSGLSLSKTSFLVHAKSDRWEISQCKLEAHLLTHDFLCLFAFQRITVDGRAPHWWESKGEKQEFHESQDGDDDT